MREKLYKSYKNHANLYMWDVYIWEAHPGDPEPQPQNFTERVKNYEIYKKNKKITMTALIDSVKNPVFGKKGKKTWWDSQPTSFYLIGIDGTIKAVKSFILQSGYYPTIEKELKKAIAEITVDTEAPKVEVISPGNSDILKVGAKHEISWKATDNIGVAKRAIYYSVDNGSHWKLIDNIDNNSSDKYQWTIPNEVSEQCKIKVYAYDKAKNVGNDESGTFKIVPPTNINFKLKNATNNIVLLKSKEAYLIYLPFSGTTNVMITDVKGKMITTFATIGHTQWYKIPKPFSSGIHIMNIKTPEKNITKTIWLVQ